MSTAQLTNLLNYIESHWGNEGVPRTILDVQTALDSCRVPQAAEPHHH